MSDLYFAKAKAVYKPNRITDVHDKNRDLLSLSHGNYNTHEVIKVLQSDHNKLNITQ